MQTHQLTEILDLLAKAQASTIGLSEQDAFNIMINFAASIQTNNPKLINFFVASMELEYPNQVSNPVFQTLAGNAQRDVVEQIIKSFSPETGFGTNGENLKNAGDEYVYLYNLIKAESHELAGEEIMPHTEL